MTVSEAAQKYELSTAWVRRLASTGKLPHAKRLGPRVWLIHEQDLIDYLATNPKPGPKPSADQQ
jgi:excisionase family DNA binding protein